MKKNRLVVTALFLTSILFSSLTTFHAGCGNDSLNGRLERVEALMRDFDDALQSATQCLQVLHDFDFENASFLGEAKSAVQSGQDSVRKAEQALVGLSSIDYGGKLMRLGELVVAYVPRAREALDELSVFYQDMESILQALEPLIEEEATITQLEVPKDQSEWRKRLERLKEAAEKTIQSLDTLTVGSVSYDYRVYFLELSALIERVVDRIIDRLPIIHLNEDIGVSADFGRIREMLQAYPLLVKGLKGKLCIFSLDPLLGEIELEINELYMDSGS